MYCPCVPQDERVDKTCEKCKGVNVGHHWTKELTRAPLVLALHLKRFEYTPSGLDDGLWRWVDF